MAIRTTICLHQPVEDRAARQATALYIFNVSVELAIGLPDTNSQLGIGQPEGWQIVQPVTGRTDAIVNGGQ